MKMKYGRSSWLLQQILSQRILQNTAGGEEGGSGGNPPAGDPPAKPATDDPPTKKKPTETAPVKIDANNPEVKKIVEAALAAEEQKRANERNKEEGKYKELYETLEPKYHALEKELADFKANNEKLTDRMKKSIEQRLAELPEHLRALDPGHEDIDKELEWIDRAAGKAQSLKDDPPPDGGNPPNPAPRGKETKDELLLNSEKALVDQGVYSVM